MGHHRLSSSVPASASPHGRLGRCAGPVLALAAVFAVTLAAGASAAEPYPDSPPSFPDLDEPHDPLLSPTGGQTDRPMLVLYVQFADQTFADTNPPPGAFEPPADSKWADTEFMDAGDIHERFFGSAPSVADYFAAVSGRDLLLVPAVDADASHGGAVKDGVVAITIDQNKVATDDADGFIDWDDPDWAAQQETLLEAAADHVDFADFDKNGDGRVTEDELIVARHDVDSQHIPGGSGGIRRAPAGLELDGVQLGGSGGLKIANSGTATNLMTLVHEAGHAAFAMPDTYFHDVARLDLGAATSNVDDLELYEPSAWLQAHLGWTEPTVVTDSGYYDVGPGDAFVLYDPDRGTDDYFLVENRRRREDATDLVEEPPGSGDLVRRFVRFESYDQGASDSGLVIWRIDESVYQPDGGDGFISLVRPNATDEAWDPPVGADLADRSMEDAIWRDGTPTDLAVRDISPADDEMRVYFDVRGPGVLIDPLTHTSDGSSVVPRVSPGEANPQRVPVMNTGETADTFEVFYDDLPAGWSSETDEVELAAGELNRTDAVPALVPAADADTGVHEVTVVARSTTDPSVRAQATVDVEVILDPTRVTYAGDTEGALGTPTELIARVTNFAEDHAPVDGVEVTFELTAKFGDDRQTATATTNADGVATATPLVDLAPGDYQLRASTERSGKHAPGATTVDYRVLTAAERVARLRDAVVDADLHDGVERSLTAQLERALAHLEHDRTTPACNKLAAFVNEVDAQRDKHVDGDDAEAWRGEARSIRAQLGCDS